MSLRDQIDQFMADHNPIADGTSAIDELLDGEGVFGLDPTLVVDAVLHYADTSPIEVADALSGFLTEHSEISSDFNEAAPIDVVNDGTGFPAEGVGAGFATFGLGAAFGDDAEFDDAEFDDTGFDEATEDIDDTVDDGTADFDTESELDDDLDVPGDIDDIDDEPASIFDSSFEDQDGPNVAEDEVDIDDFDIDF